MAKVNVFVEIINKIIPIFLLSFGIVIALSAFKYGEQGMMLILSGMMISMMGWIVGLIYKVKELEK